MFSNFHDHFFFKTCIFKNRLFPWYGGFSGYLSTQYSNFLAQCSQNTVARFNLWVFAEIGLLAGNEVNIFKCAACAVKKSAFPYNIIGKMYRRKESTTNDKRAGRQRERAESVQQWNIRGLFYDMSKVSTSLISSPPCMSERFSLVFICVHFSIFKSYCLIYLMIHNQLFWYFL